MMPNECLDDRTDDMLAIFFPHMFEDIEYLLPEELEQGADADDAASSRVTQGTQRRTTRAVQENAVAGPSRLQ